MAASKLDLFNVLVQRTGLTVVEEREREKQLRFLCRVSPKQWAFFGPIVRSLILTSEKPGNPWTCDISKLYMVRNDKVLYIWRIVFQGEAISTKYASMIAAIQAAPRPQRVELQSQLLPGYRPGDVRGGVNEKGKGVSSADSSPMILTSRMGRATR